MWVTDMVLKVFPSKEQRYNIWEVAIVRLKIVRSSIHQKKVNSQSNLCGYILDECTCALSL